MPGEGSSHLLTTTSSTSRMAAITRRLIGLPIHMQERNEYKETTGYVAALSASNAMLQGASYV